MNAEQSKWMFPRLCTGAGLPEPTKEVRFHPVRRWRFDYAWPNKKVAVECDGGSFSGGRHTRGSGFVKDLEKMNAATMLGWKLIRVTPQQLCTAYCIDMLKELLK